MDGEAHLAGILAQAACVCYYPSSGPDLGDVDFFTSGGRPLEERRRGPAPAGPPGAAAAGTTTAPCAPDVFLHSDVGFFQEFAAGRDWQPGENGLHGPVEIVDHQELPRLAIGNRIYDNLPHTGRCFAYRFRAWGAPAVKTLVCCLCENEGVVARVLLAHGLRVPVVWARNWAGGRSHGTWLVNVLHRLHTAAVYSDWLCVPGQRGEPGNLRVAQVYPELMATAPVRLARNESLHWIDEGAHGWVERFDVVPR